MKICLIGSSRFLAEYVATNRRLTLDGHVVYTIAMLSSAQLTNRMDESVLPTEEEKIVLDLVHLRKIAESDACVLVTDDTGYFGFSTKREMVWAQMLGKPIMDCRQPILKAFQEPRIREAKSLHTVADALERL